MRETHLHHPVKAAPGEQTPDPLFSKVFFHTSDYRYTERDLVAEVEE
jgi:hypothetical protein